MQNIHNLFLAHKYREMVKRIDEYGPAFWTEYNKFLRRLYSVPLNALNDYTECNIAYNSIKWGD